MPVRRSVTAFAIAVTLGVAGCSSSDRSDANSSINTAASDAAAVAHAVASDAASAMSHAPSAVASAKVAASGAVAAIRSGAGVAEHAIDDATRTAGPPSRNFARATAVKAKLIAIDAASGYATNVIAAGDGVRLTGKVSSAAVVQRFESAAGTVPGVRHVVTHLSIDANLPNPVQPAKDLALGAEVRAKLAAVGGLPVADLDVSARDGAVTLAGTVANAALRERLEKAARETPGVTRLDDTLTVR